MSVFSDALLKAYMNSYNAELIKIYKPQLVWAYIFFSGDQEKIKEFIEKIQSVSKIQLKEDLRGVNLRKYVTAFEEKKFIKICKKKKLNPDDYYVIAL